MRTVENVKGSSLLKILETLNSGAQHGIHRHWPAIHFASTPRKVGTTVTTLNTPTMPWAGESPQAIRSATLMMDSVPSDTPQYPVKIMFGPQNPSYAHLVALFVGYLMIWLEHYDEEVRYPPEEKCTRESGFLLGFLPPAKPCLAIWVTR